MLSTETANSKTSRYKAFISYSHVNQQWGKWLQKALEEYRVPSAYVGMTNNSQEKIEPKLGKIFRDRDELTSGLSLHESILAALAASDNLIVLCSPESARSSYVNQEIIEFKRFGRSTHIHALIVSGEPHASRIPGHENEECFPPALRFALRDDGQLTDRPADELIAADARTRRDGKRKATIKLIAGLLGVRYDLLYQREKRRALQRRTVLAVVVALAFVLAGTAIQNFRASRREQRKTRHGAYAAALTQAEEYLKKGDHPRAIKLLQEQRPRPGNQDLPEFAWRYLWRHYDNHRHMVLVPGGTTSIAISPDSNKLAISNGTRTVTLWDLFTGDQLARMEDPEGECRFAGFKRDGTALVTAGDKSSTRIWDAASGKLQKTYPDLVIANSSPDGTTLLLKSLELLDQDSGNTHSLYTGHEGISSSAFSEDGQKLALGYDNDVQLFDVRTGARIGYLDFRGRSTVKNVAFSPDGGLLAIGVSAKEFLDIVLYDLGNSNEKMTLKGPDVNKGELVSVLFSPDSGKVALLAGSGQTHTPEQHSSLSVWKIPAGSRLFTLDQEQTGFITAVQFSPDGKILATGGRDSAVRFRDASTGALRNLLGMHHDTWTRELEAPKTHRDARTILSRSERGGGVSQLLFSPNGKTLVTASDRSDSVMVWDVPDQPDNFPIPQQADEYSALAYSPDGKTIAVGDARGRVAIWDSHKRARISEAHPAHEAPVYAVAFSSRGDKLASASDDGVVQVWRTEGMEHEAGFPPSKKIEGYAVGAVVLDDKRLINIVVGAGERSRSGEMNATVWDLSTRRILLQVSSRLIVLSADGSRLAVIGCKTVVWDLARLESRVLFKDGNCLDSNFQRAAFSRNGQYLAAGGPTVGRDPEKKSAPPGVRLFRLAGPKSETVLPLDLGYSYDELNSLEFSADGRFLCAISAVSGRPALTVWEVPSGRQKESLILNLSADIKQYCQGAGCARIGGFSSDGEIAVITGPHGPQGGPSEVFLLRLEGLQGQSFKSRHRVDSVVFSPDSKIVATLIEPSRDGAPAVLWARETRREVGTLGNYTAFVDSVGHAASGPVLAVTFEHPASGGIVARVWDVMRGALFASLPDWGADAAGPVTLASDGRHLAVSGGTGILVWSVDRRSAVRTLQERVTRPATSVAIEGNLLAEARDGRIAVWNIETGHELRTLKGTAPVAFSPPGGKLFATTVDCASAALGDPNSGAARGTLKEDDQCLAALAFSPDSSTLATLTTGGSDFRIFFDALMRGGSMDRKPANPEARLWDVGARQVRVKLDGYEGGYDGRVAFAPDGKSLATNGKDGRVDLWDSLTGQRLISLPGLQNKISSIEFSRDGRTLAVGFETTVGVYRADEKQSLRSLGTH